MTFLISCVTTPDVIVETYRPVIRLPEFPEYPSDMGWEQDGDRFYIDEGDFRRLAEWRIRIEGYAEQVEVIWSLFDDR